MRPGKLYIKILLSFLAVLFTTLIVIFTLFLALPSKHFTTQLEEFTKKKALIIKGVVEEKIQSAPTTDLSKNGPLKDFVLNFGQIMGAKVWVQKPDGTIPLQSFLGEIPETVAKLKKKRVIHHGNITLYHQRDGDFYAVIPIAFPGGGMGTIQVLFDRQEGPFHPGRGFALGLVIIGLFAALLIVPVSRIITNRLKKLRQSALIIAEGDLSHRVDIRSKDEIGDLAQAFNRMADKLETMIRNGKELTANVSHELRTPLTRIRIAEEMLREKLKKTDSGPYEKYLDEVREDIQELDTLIGRILELSKLDIHDSPLIFSPFDPSELMQMLLLRFQSVIGHKNLQVATDLSFPPPFSGDKETLATALSNILDNATKFTPEQGHIRIQMHPVSDFLEISITNTFEELPPEELSRIFDPFHRAKRSQAAGSGLGLAIAKKSIERQGGIIGAYNAEIGLEIRITLPDMGADYA
jgi:two-component system sensor histidine kinase CpxA